MNTHYDCSTLSRDNYLVFRLFTELVQMNCPFFVLGDFNLPNDYVKPLSSILTDLALVQLIDKPTRKNNILDLIITNNMMNVKDSVVSDFCVADHNLTYCTVEVQKRKREKIQVSFRPFAKTSEELFMLDLNGKLNQHLLSNSSPSSLLNQKMDTLLQTFDIHAPILQKSFYKRQKNICF